MENVLLFLIQWAGCILSVVLALVILITTLTAKAPGSEINFIKDEENYIISSGKQGFFIGLLIMLIGALANVALGWFGTGLEAPARYGILAAELVISVCMAVIFLFKAHNSLRRCVIVNGDTIKVWPAFGKPWKTSFAEIRTVKKNGGQTAETADGIVVHTNDRKKFELTRHMSNYPFFAIRVDRDVALPNLTKKRRSSM